MHVAIALIALLALPPAARAVCSGDCDGDGAVSIAELVTLVDVGLAGSGSERCPAGDLDGDGTIAINELVAAVSAALDGCRATPTATAPPPATTTASPAATDTAPATATTVATPTGTAEPTATASAVATATGSAEPTATATATADATATATADVTATDPATTATATPVATSTGVATATATAAASASPTVSATATASATAIAATATRTATPPATATGTPPATSTASPTGTPPATMTTSPTPSASASPSASQTPVPTASATRTGSATPSHSGTPTRTGSATRTATPTVTASFTLTATRTASATPTPSFTRTQTPTRTATATRSETPTRSATPTQTGTPTASATRTATATPSPSRTATPTATATPGLGPRRFSLDPATSRLALLPDLVDTNEFAGYLDLAAGVPDAQTGLARIAVVGGSEFLSIPVAGLTFCIRPLLPVPDAGVVSCTGGIDLGVTSSQDHDIGIVGVEGFTAEDCDAAGGFVEGPGEPHPGMCNGPVEVGASPEPDSGIGAVLIAPDARFGTQGLPAEFSFEPGPCSSHEAPSSTVFGLTSALSRATIFDANGEADVVFTHDARGENFSCQAWGAENGPGRLVLAVPAAHGAGPVDLITVFTFDD